MVPIPDKARLEQVSEHVCFWTKELVVSVCEEMTRMAEVNERWVKGPRIRHAGKSEQTVRARQDHAPN